MERPIPQSLMTQTPERLILSVLVRDRSGTLFEGDAEAISSVNDKGPFDVLPLHANFISLIKQSLILHLKGEVSQEVQIQGGVLMVRENKVEVYLGIFH